MDVWLPLSASITLVPGVSQNMARGTGNDWCELSLQFTLCCSVCLRLFLVLCGLVCQFGLPSRLLNSYQRLYWYICFLGSVLLSSKFCRANKEIIKNTDAGLQVVSLCGFFLTWVSRVDRQFISKRKHLQMKLSKFCWFGVIVAIVPCLKNQYNSAASSITKWLFNPSQNFSAEIVCQRRLILKFRPIKIHKGILKTQLRWYLGRCISEKSYKDLFEKVTVNIKLKLLHWERDWLSPVV